MEEGDKWYDEKHVVKDTLGTCPSLSQVVCSIFGDVRRWKEMMENNMMRNMSNIPRELVPPCLELFVHFLEMWEEKEMLENNQITSGTRPSLSRVVCLLVAFGGSLTVAHCSTAMWSEWN